MKYMPTMIWQMMIGSNAGCRLILTEFLKTNIFQISIYPIYIVIFFCLNVKYYLFTEV